MRGLLGRKIGMTQIFDADGTRIPVTVVEVEGNVVVQKKTAQGKDGYEAVKLGFGAVKKLEKEGTEPRYRLSAPEVGVFTSAGIEAPRRHLREFRIEQGEVDQYEVGQALGPGFFQVGDWVDVSGTSKGRGFTGVMKRHNFAGAKASHGVHEYFRHGGSIGMSADPARVLPGKKMPGQHGNERVTVQNLQVVGVRPDDGVILIKGSVPGPKNGIVEVRLAIKKGRRV